MSLLTQILPAAIVAMMVAAGVCGFALFWGKERARGALAPLAVGGGYLVGHFVIAGWTSFPPADTTNWLPYFAAVAAVFGAFSSRSAVSSEGRASAPPGREESRPSETGVRREEASEETLKMPGWARWLIFAVVFVGALRLLLKPKFQYGWSHGEGWVWVFCLGCAIVLLAIILDALARRPGTAVEMPVFLVIVSAGTSGALMLSGSMLLGQFATVLAAAVVGTLIFTVAKVSLGRGIAPVFALLIGGLVVSGYFFAELPAASAGLLAFAPILALSYVGRARKLLALGIRAALVSIPVALALALAFRSSPPLNY